MKLEHCNRAACVQMIEALQAKERELQRVQFDMRIALAETETEKQWRIEAQAQVALLREALAEASNEISDWGQYASEYFQGKYKLEEVVARYAKIASGEMK